MSIVIALIGILVAVIVLFSVVSNHIEHRLNTIENKLISIDNSIKYNQYILNDKDIDTNDKEVYEWRD